MAGLASSLTPRQLAVQQLRTLAWLRWRIFVNSLRGKGAVGELVAKIVAYPILALMVMGPSVACGFGAWFILTQHKDPYLALLLWAIFLLWQFVGVSTTANGPSFDLASLTRFPMRFRDYLMVRMTFGLMDPSNLMGMGCLTGVAFGIGVAVPALLPWAALILLTYAAANILFSRMVYSWIERWLAQRKTRELVTVVILLGSLGFQVVAQSMRGLGHHGRGFHLSPQAHQIVHIGYVINMFLPPGLAAKSFELMRTGSDLLAIAALAGLAAYTSLFLFTLNKRLHAQFLGENLSEAPAEGVRVSRKAGKRSQAAAAAEGPGFALFSPAVSALLLKEFRYLLRSGPKLYSLIVPIFMVFIFSSRNSGLAYIGFGDGSREAFVFTYGCLYLQLLLVAMLYNSLGTDASGVQFYFMAPMRLRDVLLAKNLLAFGIFLVEIILIYVAAVSLSAPPSPDLTVATVAGSFFTFILGMTIGNVRSLVQPKVIDPTKVRRQNISGLNGLISLLVTAGCGAVGGLLLAGSRYISGSYWLAALVLVVLLGAAALAYWMVYRKLDSIALDNQETISSELCKA